MTVLIAPAGKGHRPGNMATIDHLRPRWHPDRGKDHECATVLACWRCNNKRDARDYNALPIEERRRLSGRYPREAEAGQPSE